jgi:PAS domain S-box-containing protein
MVDLLWRDGAPDAAIRLEELWNDLGRHYTFSLLCAYPLANFYKESDSTGFDRVCNAHTAVRSTERSGCDDAEERERRIAVLEQRAAALELEVAQRKQLERKLAESLSMHRRGEELLRDFVENGAVGLHWVAADGTIEWANEAELKLLGYTREEYVGRNIAEFHADADTIGEILACLTRNEEIRDHEARLIAKDGTHRWVSINSNVLFEDGKFVHTRCFTHDITAKKRLEEQNALLLEVTSVLTQTLDYRTRLERLARIIVPRLADWCAIDLARDGGYERVVVAHSDPQLEEHAAKLHDRWPPKPGQDFVARVLESGRAEVLSTLTDDLLVAAAHDREHLSELRKLGLRSAMIVPMMGFGRVVGAITFVAAEKAGRFTEEDLPLATDLGVRAGALIEIARLYHIAEESNRAKDDFLATLSHELRTPLTAILGWARMLSIGGLDDETLRTAVATIEQSARTQASLVDDLLDVSRVVSGKLSLETEPVDLATVVGHVLRTMHVTAEAKGIALRVAGLDERTVVQGDSTRLQQIVWNLVSNAIKFSEGGANVEVRLEHVERNAQIVVTDCGRGIAPSFLPHVFEPFRQAESSPVRSHGGLGLGLALVKYLVEAHGGTVAAASDGLGMGATFTVTLPLARRVSPARSDSPLPDLSGMVVLVVDDDASSRHMLKTALGRCGANVETAESLVAARTSLAGRRPDAVITDLAMAGEDSLTLLRELRANERTRTIPVLGLTAFQQHADAHREFDGFIRKPMDPMEVARRIAEMRR